MMCNQMKLPKDWTVENDMETAERLLKEVCAIEYKLYEMTSV